MAVLWGHLSKFWSREVSARNWHYVQVVYCCHGDGDGAVQCVNMCWADEVIHTISVCMKSAQIYE